MLLLLVRHLDIFYGILSRKAIASNDGMRPRLDQEAACGLIAGAALIFPLFLACYNKQVESMGPIAKSWRVGTSKWSHILRNGGPWLLPRIGLGMGPNSIVFGLFKLSIYIVTDGRLMQLCSKRWFIFIVQRLYMSTASAAACAQLLLEASFFNSARQTLKSKGPLGFLAGFSVEEAATKVLLFWAVRLTVNCIAILSMGVDNNK